MLADEHRTAPRAEANLLTLARHGAYGQRERAGRGEVGSVLGVGQVEEDERRLVAERAAVGEDLPDVSG